MTRSEVRRGSRMQLLGRLKAHTYLTEYFRCEVETDARAWMRNRPCVRCRPDDARRSSWVGRGRGGAGGRGEGKGWGEGEINTPYGLR
jgi:hypothetical protein